MGALTAALASCADETVDAVDSPSDDEPTGSPTDDGLTTDLPTGTFAPAGDLPSGRSSALRAQTNPSVTLTTPFPLSTTAVSVGSLPTKQSAVSRPSVPSGPSSSRATTR